jgi:putative membrane-bound dehydrogenase-like protein
MHIKNLTSNFSSFAFSEILKRRFDIACSTLLVLTLCQLAFSQSDKATDFPKPFNTQDEGNGVTPAAQALQSIKLPAGFRATLFADDQRVEQPIGMTTDARGRLWVVENYTYAQRETNFDANLRDRIVIFDPVTRERTVFWDQGQKVTSVEIGFGGVWVAAAPNLLFIPDANQDDKPDGPPQVLLNGWDDDRVRHNIVNGLRWGPDGWLYGRHGILGTSYVGKPAAPRSQRTAINCGVWRYHPTKHKFEVVAHGTTNPWGTDWDQHGEMFIINTVIGHHWHIVPGAQFRRMYGEHFDHHVYNVMPQTADHYHWDTKENWSDIRKIGLSNTTAAAGGGHAHSGFMIYQSDRWPAEFRGNAFTVNLHGRRLNRDKLARQGSAFVATHAPDFMTIDDEWFRGVELIQTYDGSVYVADWSDIGECHENDGVHRTSGRIYNINYGPPQDNTPPNLYKLSDAELVKLLRHENVWFSRQAQQQLQQRSANGTLDDNTIRLLIASYQSAKSAVHRLRALWSLNGVSRLKPSWLIEQFKNPNENVRVWSLRLLMERDSLEQPILTAIADQARREESGLVKLYLASALQKLPEETAWSVANSLARDGKYAEDRFLRHMIWYGISNIVLSNPEEAADLASGSQIPLVRQSIARRLTYELYDQPKAIEPLLKRFPNATPAAKTEILAGMKLALRGQRSVPKPKSWPAVEQAAINNDALTKLVRNISVVFGDGRAIEELKKIVNSGNDYAAQRSALKSLVATQDETIIPLLHSKINHRELGVDAITGLATVNNENTGAELLKQFAGLTPNQKSAAINTLTSRRSFAILLLDAITKDQIPASIVEPFQVRQMASFQTESIEQQLQKLWPKLRPTSEKESEKIAKYAKLLTPSLLKQADKSLGRALFNKTCAKCHRLFGRGGQIGPDLTGAQRSNLNYLVENIAAPSATLAKEYQMSIVELKRGRILNGVILAKTNRTTTLQTDKERIVLANDDIHSVTPSTLSLMPENLLDQLSTTDVAALLAYLRSPSQVPLPPKFRPRKAGNLGGACGLPPGR